MKNILLGFEKIPNKIKILLIFSALIHVYFIIYPGFKTDINSWQAWAGRLVDMGPQNFYVKGLFADYFPFFYFLLWIISVPFSFVFGFSAISSNTFILYFKFINNLFDFATAYLMFILVKDKAKNLSLALPVLYLLNPAIIFDTSVWGQTDSIPTFLMVLSIYLLNEKNNPSGSLLTNTLSILIKPLNIGVAAVLFFQTLLEYPIKKILTAVLISFICLILMCFLFFQFNIFDGLISKVLGSLSTYPYTSINAFNFWGIFGFWKSDLSLFVGITYRALGFAIFGSLFLITIFIYLRLKKIFNNIIYLSYTIISMAFFMFLTRIHERHIFPVFALLLISAFIFKSRLMIALYVLLGINYFFNLFYSYYYYDFLYVGKHTSIDFLFFAISDHTSFLSLTNLFIFVVVLAYYLKFLIHPGDKKNKKTYKKL